MTEDETVGWHHRLDGHEFEQAPGDGDGQGSLACCRAAFFFEVYKIIVFQSVHKALQPLPLPNLERFHYPETKPCIH